MPKTRAKRNARAGAAVHWPNQATMVVSLYGGTRDTKRELVDIFSVSLQFLP
jgi:hypothetical protein